MSAVLVRKLAKRYPGTQAGLFDFTLEVESGEHFVITGPSGAGKTTLLRLIAGLEESEAGQIVIGGQDVTGWPPAKRGVALVAQRPAVYPQLSVRRNLALGVELRRRRYFRKRSLAEISRVELNMRVEEAAEILGLTPLLERRGDRLSGGEQQRVALGRAWVSRAMLWLLDEPLAHLEATLRAAVRAELHLLQGRLGATMIEVTHDPGDALALGRRVAVLGGGRLEQVGPAAELYARPASRTVAASLGTPAINLADGVVLAVDDHPAMQTGHGVTVPLPPLVGERVGSGGAVSLGVRAEHIMVSTPSKADDVISLGEWSVSRATPMGRTWLATVERPGLVWQAWLTEPPGGLAVPLAVDIDQVLLFDGSGTRIHPPKRET